MLGFRGASLEVPEAEPVTAVTIEVDGVRAVSNLAAAVRFRTISHGESTGRYDAEFEGLRAFLESAYPRVHRSLGTLDNKQNVIGLLESVEHLLAEDYRPARTVYLLFGHDEEVGGAEGAAAAAALLMKRGVRFEFVLDEGGAILDPSVSGAAVPIAAVRTAEKGYLTLELGVAGAGGHSSRPPAQTPIGILSRAIVRLEANPFPARLEGAALELLRAVIPDRG